MLPAMHYLETRVRRLEQDFPFFADGLRRAWDYVDTDAASSLTKSRMVMEHLVVELYTAEMAREPRKPLFGEMLADNQFTRRIERRIFTRMRRTRGQRAFPLQTGKRGGRTNDPRYLEKRQNPTAG